jgi:hypothetical protein
LTLRKYLPGRFVDVYWGMAKRHETTDLVIEDQDHLFFRIRTREDVLRDPSTPEVVRRLLRVPAGSSLPRPGFGAWLVTSLGHGEPTCVPMRMPPPLTKGGQA